MFTVQVAGLSVTKKKIEEYLNQIGFYSLNLLRAARLVVDTGLHAFGWSRQKALDFLLNNTAMALPICEFEVDSYLSIPGEKCYKNCIGHHPKWVKIG